MSKSLEMQVFRMGRGRTKEHEETERHIGALWEAIPEGANSECVASALVNVLAQLICSHGTNPTDMATTYAQAIEATVQTNLEMKNRDGRERNEEKAN